MFLWEKEGGGVVGNEDVMGLHVCGSDLLKVSFGYRGLHDGLSFVKSFLMTRVAGFSTVGSF